MPRPDAVAPPSPSGCPPGRSADHPGAQCDRENRRLLGSYMGTAQPQLDIQAVARLWKAGRLPVDRLLSGHLGFDAINAVLDALADGSTVPQVLVPGS